MTTSPNFSIQRAAMDFERLSDRLRALQESNLQLRELIDRLATIKFQPGSLPLDDDEDNVKTELATEIYQIIKDQQQDLVILGDEVTLLDVGPNGSEVEGRRLGLERGVKRALLELKGLRVEYHTARAAANSRSELAKRQERDLILQSSQQSHIKVSSGRSSPSPWQPPRKSPAPSVLSREDRAVNASTDVTLALRRTHDMLAEEVNKSQFAHDTLKESTAQLAQLEETYSTLDTLLASSKNLVGTLLRSQKSDTWYLETAFYVLSVTIGWLVFRRLIYGPAWWLVWLPLKLFFGVWLRVFAAAGRLVGLPGVEVAESEVVRDENMVQGGPVSASLAGVDAPVVDLGRSASAKATAVLQDESMSEQVGRIIDEGQQQQIYGNEETVVDDRERNPKKRMWEEEKEASKEDPRKRDEL